MGSVEELGTSGAGFVPYGADDENFASDLVDLLADHDDALLAAYVRNEDAISYRRLRAELAAQTGRAVVHPVYFGSAMTGAGLDELIEGVTELLPAAEGDADGPVSGTVFKIERGPSGEKIAFVRMFSGTVAVRDVLWFGRDGEEKVTGIEVFEQGSTIRQESVAAGRIGRVRGLGEVRIGDAIGAKQGAPERHHFAPPTLETVVVPSHPADRGALRVALGQLAEQDPLINVRQDDARQELYVLLYGEVQKEVVGATLIDDYGIEVGEEPNPFLATVGLRVEAAAPGTGVEYRRASEVLGTMPAAFFSAVEVTVRETLNQGPPRVEGHRLLGHPDAYGLRAATEPHPPGLQQEHV